MLLAAESNVGTAGSGGCGTGGSAGTKVGTGAGSLPAASPRPGSSAASTCCANSNPVSTTPDDE